MKQDQGLKFTPVDPADAEGRVRELYQAASDTLGFVPNIYRMMACAPGLLETYRLGYGAIRAGSFAPREQETVFLTASVDNGCDYCVAAHSTLAFEDFGLESEEIAAIRDGRGPADPRLRVLWTLTRDLIDRNGRPSKSSLEDYFAAGYGQAQLLEIILAVALKVMSNFTGRLSLPDLDPRFEPYRSVAD